MRLWPGHWNGNLSWLCCRATDPSACVFAGKGQLSLRPLCNNPNTPVTLSLWSAPVLVSREITSLTGTLYLCMDSFYSPLENLSAQKSAGYITQWRCAVCLLPRHVCSVLFTSLAALVESCETSLHRDCAWGKGTCVEAESFSRCDYFTASSVVSVLTQGRCRVAYPSPAGTPV